MGRGTADDGLQLEPPVRLAASDLFDELSAAKASQLRKLLGEEIGRLTYRGGEVPASLQTTLKKAAPYFPSREFSDLFEFSVGLVAIQELCTKDEKLTDVLASGRSRFLGQPLSAERDDVSSMEIAELNDAVANAAHPLAEEAETLTGEQLYQHLAADVNESYETLITLDAARRLLILPEWERRQRLLADLPSNAVEEVAKRKDKLFTWPEAEALADTFRAASERDGWLVVPRTTVTAVTLAEHFPELVTKICEQYSFGAEMEQEVKARPIVRLWASHYPRLLPQAWTGIAGGNRTRKVWQKEKARQMARAKQAGQTCKHCGDPHSFYHADSFRGRCRSCDADYHHYHYGR